MFTQINPRDVSTEGVLETNAFSIKANGKAFKVLIDGLYSDKVRSIIRELWSNAFDSHIEAGKADVPFDCQLPTMWEPVFRVRDYGVSLSHQNVMHLYTTVFESTKEGTNAQVGKLGLGSKSPFAYVDTFTLTAWLDGEKRIYSAYIGSDSVPMIALLGKEPSDEPQGLEVSFPVKQGDVEKFTTAASRAALGFDVKPNTFDVTLKSLVEEVLYEGVGWKLFRFGNVEAQAKQGCVIYPIDADAVDGATSTMRQFLQSPLLIDFPIGELEIAASREGLGYDAPTCANIVARMAEIEKEIIAQVTERFDSIETYWEACLAFTELQDSGLPTPVKTLLNAYKFQGRNLQTKFRVDLPSIRKIDSDTVSSRRRRRRGSPGWDGQTGTLYVYPRNVKLYFQDASQHITRIKDRLKYAHATQYNPPDIIIVRAVPGSMAAKRALVALGRPPEMVKLADLPLPPKESMPTRKKVQLRVFTGRYGKNAWKEVDIDASAGGLYIPLERGEAQRVIGGANHEMQSHVISSCKDILIALDVLPKDVQIYGVPATMKTFPNNKPHWVCFWDFVLEVLADGYDAEGIGRFDKLMAFLSRFENSDIGALVLNWHTTEAELTPGSPAFNIVREYGAIQAQHEALKTHGPYTRLGSFFTAEFAPTPCDEDITLDHLLAEVSDRYPLLPEFAKNISINDHRGNLLRDYVNLVDTAVTAPNTASTDISEAA